MVACFLLPVEYTMIVQPSGRGEAKWYFLFDAETTISCLVIVIPAFTASLEAKSGYFSHPIFGSRLYWFGEGRKKRGGSFLILRWHVVYRLMLPTCRLPYRGGGGGGAFLKTYERVLNIRGSVVQTTSSPITRHMV